MTWFVGVFALPSFANSISGEQHADEKRVVVSDKGVETASFEPAERVQPSQTVRFTLHRENGMYVPAEDVVLEMPVP